MKKFFSLFLLLAMTTILMAQAPQKFTYQAVVRDAASNLVANAPVGVRVSILKSSASGIAVYCETHRQNTNASGMLLLEIGGGTVAGGDFSAIDWASGPYFLKTEMDVTGGTNYTIASTQQLLSVPYALYAGNALKLEEQYNKLEKQLDSLKQNGGGTGGGGSRNPNDGKPCPGAATVTDYDGNIYNTVQIGDQCWMKENLKTTKYSDGTSISQGNTISADVAYWYYPNGNSSNKATYGLLYNWKATMRNSSSTDYPNKVQGVCPTGWHVPGDFEWTLLTEYLSRQGDYCCMLGTDRIAKALASTTGWVSHSGTCAVGNTPSSNNATGFGAFPAGGYDGGYYGFGNGAGFWSATEYISNDAYGRGLYYDYAGVGRNGNGEYGGFSVRCLRDF